MTPVVAPPRPSEAVPILASDAAAGRVAPGRHVGRHRRDPGKPARSTLSALSAGSPAVVLAALVWGTNGLAASFLPVGVPPVTVAAARLLAGGALFAVLCRAWRPGSWPGRPAGRSPAGGEAPAGRPGLVPLAMAALGMATYQVCYFAALDSAGVAVTSVVTMGSLPVFTGVITAVTDRARPSRRWYAATALAVTGGTMLCLAQPAGHAAAGGVLEALAAGASYALFTTACSRMISRGADCRATMAGVLLTAGAALGPVLLVAPVGWLATGCGLGVVGYLAGVSTVAAYLLYGRGLRTTGATTASTLALAEPACAAVIGVLVLHEPSTPRTVAGLLLVAVALVLLTAPRWRRPRWSTT